MGIRLGKRNRVGTKGSDQAGGGCLLIFGLFFGGMGLLFFVIIFRSFLAEAETYTWEKTPCELTFCEVEVSDGQGNDSPFRLSVGYKYRFQGSHFTSSQYSRQGKTGDEYENLALKRRELLRELDRHCYVNPKAPAEAVLKREALSTGLFSLFPLIFVAVGLGLAWGGVVSMRKEKAAKKEPEKTKSISEAGKKSAKLGAGVGVGVGLLFVVVGFGIAVGMAMGPIKRMFASKSWVETPCKVIWSRVQRHEGDDSTTYSVDIFYEYEFDGETYRSNRYSAMSGSSSGYSGKDRIVKQHPKGSQQICYVNPKLPEQAILKPGFSPMAFLLLLPLAFVAAGLAILIASLRAKAKQTAGLPGFDPGRSEKKASFSELAGSMSGRSAVPAAAVSESSTGPVVLKPHASRWIKLGGILFFALFWNGIVSVFLYQVVEGWRNGNGEIFLTLFLIPFLLIGLGVIVGFFYQLLAMANPKPVITLDNGHPRLGEPMTVSWTVSGKTSRVVDFSIALWGVESATYRRGTNTVTSTEVFYEQVLIETAELHEIESGSATITIPADLMYSLKLDNNQIKYELKVKGDIPLWPDIGDSFELTLLPPRLDPV